LTKLTKVLSIGFSIAIVKEQGGLLGFSDIIRDVTKQFQEKGSLKKN